MKEKKERTNTLISKKHLPFVLKREDVKYIIQQKDNKVHSQINKFLGLQLTTLISEIKEQLALKGRKTIDRETYVSILGSSKNVQVTNFDRRMFSTKIIRQKFKTLDLNLGDKQYVLGSIKQELYNRLHLLISLAEGQMSLVGARTLKVKYMEMPLMYLNTESQLRTANKKLRLLQTQLDNRKN